MKLSKRLNKYAVLLVGAGLIGLSATNASATSLLYNDFSSVAGLQINGDAAQVGNALRVTPSSTYKSGSFYSTDTISLAADASFSSAFRFQISNSGGWSDADGIGADGLVFTVQTNSNTTGGNGGGLGYLGIPNSVGIEFDTWDNGTQYDTGGNQVGIDINGDINSVARVDIPTRMNNASIWSAWVDYNGVTDDLEVRLVEGDNALRPLAALLSYNVDLTTVLGTTDAYVGFTSGTGAAYGDHDILAWQFNSTYDPISNVGVGTVPVPATLLLFGLGLAGFGIKKRKRKVSILKN